MEELIKKLTAEAGSDHIKKQIVRIIEEILKTAPECAACFETEDKGLDAVYGRMRRMGHGTEEDVLNILCEVYKLPVRLEIELCIVRRGDGRPAGEPKVLDLFDFM